jgi:cation transport regulator ChaC
LDPGAAVHGVLWYIDDEVLQALDHYEGYPYYYTRIMVNVWQDGEPMQALVYVMNDQSWEDLPSKDYLLGCQEGYISSNVPVDQIDAALEHLRRSPHWDPVFNRMKRTAAREFGESILKAEYYEDD